MIVDVQNDFVDGKLGTQEAINMIPNLKEKIKNFDGEIIYTMDTHDDNYLNTQEGRKLPIKHCIKGTDAWKIRECNLGVPVARTEEIKTAATPVRS